MENVPVVAGKDSDELVGVLDYSKVLRKISAEVLHRRERRDISISGNQEAGYQYIRVSGKDKFIPCIYPDNLVL